MGDIGKIIREEREIHKLSQAKLAKVLGVKQNTVSQYENNVLRPSYEILIKIADYFDISIDYLLGRE